MRARAYFDFAICLNSASFCYARPCLVFVRSVSLVAFLFCRPRDASFQEESGTRSREIRSRIGKQSVGRTLRGLLLSRRSLPFKPPPILTLPRFLHPASSYPSPYLVPPSRGTFLSPSFSFLCTLGKPAFTLPRPRPLSPSPSLRPPPPLMGEFSPPSSPPRFSTKPDGET